MTDPTLLVRKTLKTTASLSFLVSSSLNCLLVSKLPYTFFRKDLLVAQQIKGRSGESQRCLGKEQTLHPFLLLQMLE